MQDSLLFRFLISEAVPDRPARVGQRLLLAGEHAHRARGHGLLLKLARIGRHRSNPAAAPPDVRQHILKAQQSAGQYDAVHPALEHSRHAADRLADLVNHRLPHARRARIALIHHGVNRVGIGRAEVARQAARLAAKALELALRAAAQRADDIRHRHGAHARRGERALAAARVVAVDHPAMCVRRHGNAAVDVADDQVAVLIALAQAARMPPRRLLEVERMADGRPVHAAHTGHARQVAELIDDRWVHHQHQAAVFIMQHPGHLHTEHGSMVQSAPRLARVLDELVVDVVHAAEDGITAAAAAHDRIDAVQIDLPVAQEFMDDRHPVIELVVDRRESQQDGGIVKRILRKQAPVIFKHRELGRGRARIDDKNAVSLHNFISQEDSLCAIKAHAHTGYSIPRQNGKRKRNGP